MRTNEATRSNAADSVFIFFPPPSTGVAKGFVYLATKLTPAPIDFCL